MTHFTKLAPRVCFCPNVSSLDWHHKIEGLTAKLVDVSSRASITERELVDTRCRAETDVARLQDDLVKLRDRYDRLFESHKRLQKLNNELEDKLITVVSKLEVEKRELTESLCSMQQKLTAVETVVQDLEDERERLKNDCILAVQLLHCRPSDFVAYKLNELPVTLQERVRSQLTRKEILELEEESDDSTDPLKPVSIPIPTFPPTAAVCAMRSANQSADDGTTLRRINTVPMSLVAQALLPPDDDALPRRRRGDSYVCAVCRRCDSAIDYSSAGNGRPATLLVSNEEHVRQMNAGIHVAKKSPTQPNLTLARS